MSPMVQIGLLIVGTLGSLYLTVIVLRFLFQLAKADFYNPISQIIVKATNPVLIPIRRVIPGFYGIDISSIVFAILFHWLVIQILAFILGASIINPITAITWAVVGLISLIVNIYFYGMIIMIIASWIAPGSYNPILLLIRQIVAPITAPFRKIIPPMGGLDITPIFVFLALQVCRIMIQAIAQKVGLTAQVAPIVLGI
ncbi:MAG: YggT family protein [Cellvibrionaceae bacterium]